MGPAGCSTEREAQPSYGASARPPVVPALVAWLRQRMLVALTCARTVRPLQDCSPDGRLTAAQEALCGELVQAAKAAAALAVAALEQQPQQQPHEQPALPAAPATAGAGRLAAACSAELRCALNQGAAASLLLQRCNLGLVGLMQRRVTRGRQLTPSLFQVCMLGTAVVRACACACACA